MSRHTIWRGGGVDSLVLTGMYAPVGDAVDWAAVNRVFDSAKIVKDAAQQISTGKSQTGDKVFDAAKAVGIATAIGGSAVVLTILYLIARKR